MRNLNTGYNPHIYRPELRIKQPNMDLGIDDDVEDFMTLRGSKGHGSDQDTGCRRESTFHISSIRVSVHVSRVMMSGSRGAEGITVLM